MMKIVNAALASPDWKSTAIFTTWDDWGGFSDYVVARSDNYWPWLPSSQGPRALAVNFITLARSVRLPKV